VLYGLALQQAAAPGAPGAPGAPADAADAAAAAAHEAAAAQLALAQLCCGGGGSDVEGAYAQINALLKQLHDERLRRAGGGPGPAAASAAGLGAPHHMHAPGHHPS
jgi:hypothetical protein